MAASLLPHLSKIRSPLGGEKVYKDECAFCFDTPEHETGLYVCMNTFLGLGKRYVEPYSQKTGNVVFLHMKRIKKQLPKKEDVPEQHVSKPTKMAIGVEGGFDVGGTRFEFDEINTIIVLPKWTEIPLNTPDLPDQVQISVASILAADSAAKAAELAAMAGTWEGDIKHPSKFADNLVQHDNGKKIPPTGWKCEKCEKTENVWLNLTDGSILCGRKFWDGSGGNNHAVEHYETCKFPLAVKLGTITPDGADVYSYAEDEMVLDPNLKQHLAHWGINIAAMEKTEKTMLELEIDLNQKIGEWDVITEAGSKLKPVYGPGFTGMINLGNSCYMNSVMQVLFTLPEFKTLYADCADRIFAETGTNPTEDFNLQMAKLGKGLLSGDYSIETPEIPDDIKEPVIRYPEGIRPQMFKTLVGKGHPEFSTKKQQDAQEFLLHLIDMIEKGSRGKGNPVDCLRFEVEDRIMCTTSNKVKYATRNEFILSVPIPMDAATNKEAVRAYDLKKGAVEAQKQILTPADIVRPKITLAACLEAFAATEVIPDFYSSAVQGKSIVHKTTMIKTFPDNLFIQLRKFTIGDDWVPKKLDVSIEIPDELNLEFLRGTGIQPGEEELPETPVVEEPEFQIDDGIVMQLVSMGFALEGCKKAVFHTKNAGVEYAMNWVMEHMEDPDFADPFVQPGRAAKKAKTEFVPNDDALVMIMGMGFTRDQAIKALKATDNNIERAADWIFSHSAELDAPMETDAPSGGEQSSQERKYKDGSGRYKLVGFISHMGTSSMVGHYVCHILKDGRWTIFNDEKVALSEKPPKDLAYLYHYRRV